MEEEEGLRLCVLFDALLIVRVRVRLFNQRRGRASCRFYATVYAYAHKLA